jgi:hypothetical protein
VTSAHSIESAFERWVALTMLVIFWLAFGSLGAGLGLWVLNHGSGPGALLMAGGLLALMILPTLRLVSAIATARRERDWLTLWSTLIVLAILAALTFRDAVTRR